MYTVVILWLQHRITYRHPTCYQEELNCQCEILLIPMCLMAILAWLPFLFLDRIIYPEISVLWYLRLGFPLIALTAILLHKLPLHFPYKGSILFSGVITYLFLASGLILGLVKGDPVYLGGYSIVILTLPLTPIRITHSLIMMVISLGIFVLTGFIRQMDFTTGHQWYGLSNLAVAVMASLISIIITGHIRKNIYRDDLLIQQKKDQKNALYFQEKGISKREQEIIALIIQGCSNQQIEEHLNISGSTVKTHIYNIYQKLEIKNRIQLHNLVQHISTEW